MTARNWVFTINNHFSIDLEEETWNNNLKLLIAVKEVGEQGTEHLQGYLELIQPRRFSWVKERLPLAHLEKRRGSKKQAIQYCLKTISLPSQQCSSPSNTSDTSPQDVDSTIPLTIIYPPDMNLSDLYADYCRSKQTKRQILLAEVRQKLSEGVDDLTIANEYFDVWVSNYRAFERYRTLITPPRNHEVNVIVIQGPTGTGKSKWCLDNYPNAYWKQRSNWWDGYSGHDTVIIDEFYGWLPFDLLLRVCDRYPLLVESKGGQIQFVAKTIIITSNSVPSSWYRNSYFDSFVRRVSKWMVFPIWGDQLSFTDYSEAIAHFVNNY
ncbi:replication-associated protein [Avon-Heathcote Estuary associated circular virus 18]|nr:replication-associated protein [Avon-Heathcote Estuary associated circular virus 18]